MSRFGAIETSALAVDIERIHLFDRSAHGAEFWDLAFMQACFMAFSIDFSKGLLSLFRYFLLALSASGRVFLNTLCQQRHHSGFKPLCNCAVVDQSS